LRLAARQSRDIDGRWGWRGRRRSIIVLARTVLRWRGISIRVQYATPLLFVRPCSSERAIFAWLLLVKVMIFGVPNSYWVDRVRLGKVDVVI
jgi:hypothetical protein